jgi:DNA-binding phage protein
MSTDLDPLLQMQEKYATLSPFLDERSRRLWCAIEARAIGVGGISFVSKATGVSRPTIYKGLKDIDNPELRTQDKLRRKGGGRKKLTQTNPDLLTDLKELVSPSTLGSPENPLLWSSKSTVKLAHEMNQKGYQISQHTVYNLLSSENYSLKSNNKTKEGTKVYADRDAQFQFINDKVKEFQSKGFAVLSVDTKKKENIGNFKNNGREWSAQGETVDVNVYDFKDKELGKAAPYGVYDISQNVGWVSIGISSDTAEFAVASIRNWWYEMGKEVYEGTRELMITADCGGSNGNRVRLWKYELQRLAEELDMSITVCHFPPGTSKWNKIEHRMFCYISKNWRARPLTSLQTIVELIGNTTTTTGLKIRSKVDNKTYKKGRIVSREEFQSIQITPMEFHGEWNYTIHPNSRGV